jgi:glutamate racemase
MTTHYPLVEEVFRDALGPDVAVYSQPRLVADSLADYLARRPEMRGPGEKALFLTSGDPKRVSTRATQFLRSEIRFQSV